MLLPLAALLAVASASSAASDVSTAPDVVDAYNNTIFARTGGHRSPASSSRFVVARAGWLRAVQLRTAVPPGGLTVTLVVNNASVTFGRLHAPAGGSHRRVAWRSVSLAAATPVDARDAVSFVATCSDAAQHGGHCAFDASTANGTGDLCAAFAIEVLRVPVTISADDGRGDTQLGYSFTSAPLVLPRAAGGAQAANVSVASFAVLTDIYPTALEVSLLAGPAQQQLYRGFINPQDNRTGVRWTVVGLSHLDAAGGGAALAPGLPLTAVHSSLDTSRTYAAGVRAGGSGVGAAIAAVTLRLPGPHVAVSTDDGSGATGTAGAFSSRVIAVATSGVLRALDLRTDTALATVCTARITVTAGSGAVDGGGGGGGEGDASAPGAATAAAVPRVLDVHYLNNGHGPQDWRSLPLAAPLVLRAPARVHVAHSCGGASYASGVRADDGSAAVAFLLETDGGGPAAAASEHGPATE